MCEDLKWRQRFSNYVKALHKLNSAIFCLQNNHTKAKTYNSDFGEILKDSVVHRFAYTHELAWNVMKDYAEYQGANNLAGSRDATRQGFAMQLITKADAWMDMLKSRNLTTHTYNSDTVEEIYRKIIEDYQDLFIAFEDKMETLRSGTQSQIFDKQI